MKSGKGNQIQQVNKKKTMSKTNKLYLYQQSLINCQGCKYESEKGNFESVYSSFGLRFIQPNHTKKIHNKSIDLSYTDNGNGYHSQMSHSFIEGTNEHMSSKKKGVQGSIGLRLYNQAIYLRQKLELEREIQRCNMIRRANPIFLTKGYNPNASFTDRRHQGSSLEIYTKRNSSNEQMKSKKVDLGYTFKPSLDKKSMIIASKLETSKSRLLSKKKKHLASNSLSLTKHATSQSPFKAVSSTQNNYYAYIRDAKKEHLSNSHQQKRLSKRVIELYEGKSNNKTINPTHHHDISINNNNNEENTKGNSNISIANDSNTIKTIKQTSQVQGPNIYEKNVQWREYINTTNLLNRIKKVHDEHIDCTFSPDITPLNISNDLKIIKMNNPSINDYIIKRRSFIQQKEKEKQNNQKRFYEYSNNNNIYKTHCSSVNSSFQQIKEDKNNPKDSLSYINKMRKDLNTKQFFFEHSEEINSYTKR